MKIADVHAAASALGRRSVEARVKKWGKKNFVRKMRQWGRLGGRPKGSGTKRIKERG